MWDRAILRRMKGLLSGRRGILLLFLVALCGLISLHIYVANMQPQHMNIKDIGLDDVGKLITTEGRVKSVHTASNFTIIEIEDEKAVIDVFIGVSAHRIAISPNDWVHVKGEVALYDNKLEIVVRRSEDIRVIK